MSRDVFSCHNWGVLREREFLAKSMKTLEGAERPTMHGTTAPPPPKNTGSPNVNSAEAEETWDSLLNDKQPHIPKVQMLLWHTGASGIP